MVKTPKFPMQWAWVQFLVGELKSHMLYNVAKKKRVGAYRMMEMFWNLSIVVRSQVSSFIKIHWIVQFKLYINKVDKNIFQVFISSEMYSFIGNMQKNKFSCSVVSDSLWPHGLHYARLPCTSPTPGACSNSCLSSWWCHPIVSSSVVPFSSCLQSFPASGSFPVSQFFISDGQSIAVSASASVLPMNIQDWFPLGLIGWISLQSMGLSRVFSNITVQKHQFFSAQLSL